MVEKSANIEHLGLGIKLDISSFLDPIFNLFACMSEIKLADYFS